MLITVESNARSKTWHDVKTNSRGRKMEEYLGSKQLHIINEESDRFTFCNGRIEQHRFNYYLQQTNRSVTNGK